jgi:hypothetical protein
VIILYGLFNNWQYSKSLTVIFNISWTKKGGLNPLFNSKIERKMGYQEGLIYSKNYRSVEEINRIMELFQKCETRCLDDLDATCYARIALNKKITTTGGQSFLKGAMFLYVCGERFAQSAPWRLFDIDEADADFGVQCSQFTESERAFISNIQILYAEEFGSNLLKRIFDSDKREAEVSELKLRGIDPEKKYQQMALGYLREIFPQGFNDPPPKSWPSYEILDSQNQVNEFTQSFENASAKYGFNCETIEENSDFSCGLEEKNMLTNETHKKLYLLANGVRLFELYINRGKADTEGLIIYTSGYKLINRLGWVIQSKS